MKVNNLIHSLIRMAIRKKLKEIEDLKQLLSYYESGSSNRFSGIQ